MTTEQFVNGLQNFAELNGDPPNDVQWNLIKEHLQTAFFKTLSIQKVKKEENEIIFFPHSRFFTR